ncbi:MAG: hypothetical protein HN534_02020 [Euryarchaeota archaeon]|nr:hypothetical protein [Euryarchaeota archaeon]MBT3653696.1 hypothetical protein [Euryarchaeota archaeon]MBT3757829.1 hypothetical protein [Euryarchaeota archaeon]MBT4051097.1 hypothetical protein [Euryarchaeota archaeon]MBT4346638.1 hypothetical protein [Euryarchaeota archaeon]
MVRVHGRAVSAISFSIMMIVMSMSGMIGMNEFELERKELQQEPVALYATSPGHVVFAQYITSTNCGFCMDYGSPGHDQLNNNFPDEYVYISLHSANYGNTADSEAGNIAPIFAVTHLGETGGAPKTAFGDSSSNMAVGCGANTCWDSYFSNGGYMPSNVNDFGMAITQTDNGDGTASVTIGARYLGSGTPPTNLKVYAAVTDMNCEAHPYTNGYKGGNCWEAWLLNNADYASNNHAATTGTGFETINLASSGDWSNTTWTVPINLVAQGFSNFNTVAALFSDYQTTNADESVYAAIDATMMPLIDVGITTFETINEGGTQGFIAGDMISLEVTLTNNGENNYNDGGDIEFFFLDGSDEISLGSSSLSNFAVGATQVYSADFDSTGLTLQPSGTTTFRARLSNIEGDRVSSNDISDTLAFHDMPPVANAPTSISSPTISRGSQIQFEADAISNDLVDDMSTMTPTLESSLAETNSWSNVWVTEMELVGTGGNAHYLFTIQTPMNADTGSYHLRIMWTDEAGQSSGWLISQNAFFLENSLPRLLTNGDDEYAGMPTVKVETVESVSILGLITDSETPLSMLTITSESPEYISWDSSTLSILVEFSAVIRDSHGSPLPQGIHVVVDDGDDTNSGILLFNVIENGAPRWSPIPTQSFDEGGAGAFSLTNYLSDTDENGQPISVAGLSLSIISISDETLATAELSGHSLSVSAVDDDSFGNFDIVLRASDGNMFSDTTVTFVIQNINDAPRIELTEYEEITIQTGDRVFIELIDLVTDVDDSDDEIWITAMTFVPGAVQYNPISGTLTMSWDEAGTELVTISAEDRHGDSTSKVITITIVDDLPLYWENNGVGDLSVEIDTMDYYTNPEITISNIGELSLSEIKVLWNVCNSVTGICHSAGTSHNLGPFIVTTVSDGGLGVGDYLTLVVTAVDDLGMNRVSDEWKQYAIEAIEDVEPTDTIDDSEPVKKFGSIATFGMIGIGLLAMVSLVLVLLITLRRQKEVQAVDWSTHASVNDEGTVDTSEEEDEEEAPDLLSNVPPPPLMSPPLPPEGLPAGWTMEQWHYYGAEYLSRRE